MKISFLFNEGLIKASTGPRFSKRGDGGSLVGNAATNSSLQRGRAFPSAEIATRFAPHLASPLVCSCEQGQFIPPGYILVNCDCLFIPLHV